jgi:hypothetical protein
MVKKIIVLSILGLIVLLGFKGCEYLNLKVAEKYETDTWGISSSSKLKEIELKSIEIHKAKMKTISVSLITLPVNTICCVPAT